MFTLRLTYLTGRVFSSEFDDGDYKSKPEWPPHPTRLFSAMVSAWAERGRDEEEQTFLEWLERQEAPELHIDEEPTAWTMPNTYVPVNDPSTPEARSRKPRVFPSMRFSEATGSGGNDHHVSFVWPNTVLPPELDAPMRRVLRSVTYLGHSTSLVWLRPGSAPGPEKKAKYAPLEEGDLLLRTPTEGRLRELVELHALWQKRPEMKVFRPSRGAVQAYGEPGVPKTMPVESLFKHWVVFAFGPRVRFPATAARVLAAALRSAAMKESDLWAISGHSRESSKENPAPATDTHIAYVSLPMVGHPYASGGVAGIAALLPALPEAEHLEAIAALHRVRSLDVRGSECQVQAITGRASLESLQPYTWKRRSKVWTTVTPMVFDRYPSHPDSDEAREIVRLACERIGLPAPACVELSHQSWVRGALPAGAFLADKPREGKPRRWHTHVRLEFSQDIVGPVVIGAGRYHGYGLCLPVWETRQ